MACEDREPLEKELAKRNPNKYRITSNKEEQQAERGGKTPQKKGIEQ